MNIEKLTHVASDTPRFKAVLLSLKFELVCVAAVAAVPAAAVAVVAMGLSLADAFYSIPMFKPQEVYCRIGWYDHKLGRCVKPE